MHIGLLFGVVLNLLLQIYMILTALLESISEIIISASSISHVDHLGPKK